MDPAWKSDAICAVITEAALEPSRGMTALDKTAVLIVAAAPFPLNTVDRPLDFTVSDGVSPLMYDVPRLQLQPGSMMEGAMRNGISRRDIVPLLIAAAAWPQTVQAVGEARKIGVLWHAGSEEEEAVFLVPFREELKKLGWPEGRLSLENRYPAERYERWDMPQSSLNLRSTSWWL